MKFAADTRFRMSASCRAAIGAHVLQRERLGLAFEALEERHVAREMRHFLFGQAAAAVHAGKVVDAVLAFGAHAVADHVPRAQHALHFLVGAFEYRAARVADDRVERIAEAVRGGGRGYQASGLLISECGQRK